MRILLDAHVLIWTVDRPALLTAVVASAFQDRANHLFVSAASIWEISIKACLRKLTLSGPFSQWVRKAMEDLELTLLPIQITHAEAHVELPYHHRDPFDRMLVAQAEVEQLLIASADAIFDRYGSARLW